MYVCAHNPFDWETQTFIPNKPGAASQSNDDNEAAVRDFQAVVSDASHRDPFLCVVELNFKLRVIRFTLVQEERQLVS